MPLIECEICLEEKPESYFPDLKAGEICGTCWTGKPAEMVEKKIRRKALSMGRRLSDLSTEGFDSLGKVRDLIANVYTEFGGPSSYATHLHWVLIKMSDQEKIPSAVPQVMLNLMKLHHEIERAEEVVQAREMNDEQLQAARELEMAKLLMEAANDPEKRKFLEPYLARSGLKLVEQSSDEIMEDLKEKACG